VWFILLVGISFADRSRGVKANRTVGYKDRSGRCYRLKHLRSTIHRSSLDLTDRILDPEANQLRGNQTASAYLFALRNPI
jgi:hypothetical protein